jgi:hypothetical protein
MSDFTMTIGAERRAAARTFTVINIARMSIAGLALGTLLGLPAAPARAEDAAAGTRKKDTFLWLNSISGWNAIDDEHLVLHGPGRRKIALVTTVGRCIGLHQAETIAVQSPLRYIDEHVYGDIFYGRIGGIRSRCAIRTVENVKSLKDARLLVAQRKADAKGPSATP